MPATPASSGQIKPFFSLKVKSVSNWTALLVTVLISSLVLSACGPNPTNLPQPTPTESSNLKISSVLLNIFLTYQTAPGTEEEKKNAAIQYARNIQVVNSKDEAIFEVELDQASSEQAIKDKVKAMGGIVRNSENMEGTVKMRIAVPIAVFINYSSGSNKDNFLQDLASFQGVKTIDLLIGREPMDLNRMPQTEEALAQLAQVSKNEGVKLMGADKWQTAGFKGKGTRVGVIDAGFKYYEKFLGTTLPAGLKIKDIDEEEGGPGVIDEAVHGTAVLEIIYSLAPEADYAAVAVDGSDGQIKKALDYLVKDQKVSIVSVSLGGHGSPGNGTSAIDKYIDKLHDDYGVVFLFSAGNEGYSHYSAFFNPDADGFHQFVPGVTRMALGNPSSKPVTSNVILNWEQWGLDKKQINDLDIFIVDKDGKTVLGSSQNAQSVRNPVEILPVKLAARQNYYIRVRQKPGTNVYAKPFRVHLFGHDTAFQFIVPQMAVAEPADAKTVLAVGAIQWEEDRLASYSSQGPLPDGRFKPDISAPAGVTSRAYAEEGVKAFDGTSAACPEAAGVATILKGANPKLTTGQLETLLRTSVKDLTPVGPDYANGYGRLNIGDLKPAAGILPQGNVPTIPAVDISTLQFPVLVFTSYPAPVADAPVVSKIAPAPLPTLTTKLEDGAGDFSSPGFSGSGKAPVPTATPGSKLVPTRTPVPVPPRTASPGTTLAPVTPTPEAPVLPVSSATFKDNFKDTTSGLPNKGDATYQNGSYRLKAATGQLNWGSYPASLLSVTDFSAEVQVSGIANRAGIYGLIFWQQDANNYYLLSLTGTGQYQVSQFNAGTYKEIIGWNITAGWKAGATNNLRLVANQGTVIVSINDQPGKAGQARGQGAIGFAAGSYTNPVEASFTDFRLSSGK